ncbi:FMN reductase (NADPH) [Peribacillus cavernae]|uniref:FMN reductase (NADPH) n=1 Tax=Peribacillus cavernae TaxID=1674310 RepID=A0A3S0VB63_9BACI|nr:NADPH-dependent FMN reductase [Peribacillus cavernae]MDQ0219245.1 FMN reductase [Peribacillus cavernae]RUQ28543.1 FMN reductase (NADPH) [Peribacillus cavernae]
MSDIVTISGSPSTESKSTIVLKYLKRQLEEEGLTVKEISVLDVEPNILLNGEYNHPSITSLVKNIQNAKGVIIASPVYKAAYSGALKALLDLFPQDAFQNKPVYPLMVGGSQAHLLAIDFSLKPLLAGLHAQTILKGVYLTEKQIDKTNDAEPIVDSELLKRVREQLHQFAEITKKLSSIPV